MKRVFLVIFLTAAFSLLAAAPPRGSNQLRELVVFPEMNLTFNFGLSWQGDYWGVTQNVDLPSEIGRLHDELKRHPDDIKQILRLGFLLCDDDQTNESASCFRKVKELCQNKAAVNPQDGLNLADLGEALWQLDEYEKAESVYRKATLVSSNEWRCWVRCGNFWENHGFNSLFPKNMRSELFPTGQEMPQELLDYRPSPEALEKSGTLLAEASQCYNRAMALAPQEPEVFVQCAGFLMISNLQACFTRHYREEEKVDSATLLSAFYSKEAIANLEKAGALSSRNCDYISLAAYFDWMRAMIQVNPKTYTPDVLPEATRQSIQNAMTQLESLSQSSDKKLAAGALENHGALNMVVFGNTQAATADFRQAVSLDPTREQSWDLWLGMLADSASPEEKVAVCEQRLKSKDSARNHLLLARAFEHQEKWDKAGEQAKAALKLEPDNFIAHLELTALALKQSADPKFMSQAGKQITLSQAVYEKLPDSKEKQSRWRELTLNIAIFTGFVDSPEYKKAARAGLEAVLEHYPDDERAKAISNALN